MKRPTFTFPKTAPSSLMMVPTNQKVGLHKSGDKILLHRRNFLRPRLPTNIPPWGLGGYHPHPGKAWQTWATSGELSQRAGSSRRLSGSCCPPLYWYAWYYAECYITPSSRSLTCQFHALRITSSRGVSAFQPRTLLASVQSPQICSISPARRGPYFQLSFTPVARSNA